MGRRGAVKPTAIGGAEDHVLGHRADILAARPHSTGVALRDGARDDDLARELLELDGVASVGVGVVIATVLVLGEFAAALLALAAVGVDRVLAAFRAGNRQAVAGVAVAAPEADGSRHDQDDGIIAAGLRLGVEPRLSGLRLADLAELHFGLTLLLPLLLLLGEQLDGQDAAVAASTFLADENRRDGDARTLEGEAADRRAVADSSTRNRENPHCLLLPRTLTRSHDWGRCRREVRDL